MEEQDESCTKEIGNRAEKMERGRDDQLDEAARGTLYPERIRHCAVSGQQEGFAERTHIGTTDADLLYQPRWEAIAGEAA